MPSREVVSDIERAAYGEITAGDVIANIGKRHRDAEIRGQRLLHFGKLTRFST
jgi:hypothetical protein